ncbi:MAG: SCP2 sterol-binding domain-containing protein [Anaerolineae bacterium]|nr:SCP2 sterol-binding domain-containing protein [Anaerolineae bacterium]MDQ7034378.1 SCP2 sterol-binding domain-containing protein [Anaerolineae bacterium]
MATQEEINEIFPAMVGNLQADKAADANTTIQFELSGDNGGVYWVTVNNGTASHGTGAAEADLTVKAVADDFHSIVTGSMNPMQAFMMGKIKVTDTNLALKMINWFDMG